MVVDFCGKKIAVKEFDCCLGTLPPKRIAPFVNLFVKVTNGCNAHCLFCSNAGAQPASKPFDIDKLEDIILKLKVQGIKVNRLNITGGEPSVVYQLVENILQRMYGKVFDDIHLHLNTNGLLAQSQELMRHPRWDSISMSLHHYDIDKLSELYGCNIPEDAFKFEGVNKQKLNVSCNLIKGYIDSPEEAHKMLDFALQLGIPRIGFVALMKVNSYCKERFIDLEDIHIDTIPHVYFTKSMNRGDNCKCSNYLYNKDLKILEIYMRNYANPQYCESSLVYDGEYLRQGFHQDNIIY
ncbi:MAG: radical SAM protein [Bacteroidaceae bacterium]|nr:radical SAM protein [Bacteroidaceae bacterium]